MVIQIFVQQNSHYRYKMSTHVPTAFLQLYNSYNKFTVHMHANLAIPLYHASIFVKHADTQPTLTELLKFPVHSIYNVCIFHAVSYAQETSQRE